MSADPPNYLRRRVIAVLCGVFILLVGVGVPYSLLGPVPKADAVVSTDLGQSTAAGKIVFPDFGASAVGLVGVDGADGVIGTHGSQAPRSIASITKIITSLVVLQKKPLADGVSGPTITFHQADVDILQNVLNDGGSYAAVQAGWKLSQRETMETMLLPSANNYAESLAIWAYGSVPKYLVAARAYLSAHGLRHTTIVDTNGLDNGDRSTPGDLVALGKLALASPVIADIVSESSATEPNIGMISNTNALLGSDGVDGIKTGTTTAAGSCLLFAAKVTVAGHSLRIVGVILGAVSHPALDARVPALLASVKKGVHLVRLTTRGEALATYHTAWGGRARAVAARNSDVLVWSKQQVLGIATVDDIRGGAKGQKVGTARFAVGDRRIAVPLLLDRSVLAAPFWWRLTHPLR